MESQARTCGCSQSLWFAIAAIWRRIQSWIVSGCFPAVHIEFLTPSSLIKTSINPTSAALRHTLNSPAPVKTSWIGCRKICVPCQMGTGFGAFWTQELVQSMCKVPSATGTVPWSINKWSLCTARTWPSLTMSLTFLSCTNSSFDTAAPWQHSGLRERSRRHNSPTFSQRSSKARKLPGSFNTSSENDWAVFKELLPKMASRH
mmetsp:Transcript_89417/g.278238  ORF Transcript_89417/g.278238 Transcript_89417/m.278238 type:complete len:203 (+) Transcript_89417:362-970(+)